MQYFCDNKRHLVCKPYSRDNLHAMAKELGIKRCWFHIHHYDIPQRRITEIQAKCNIVSSRDIVKIISEGNQQQTLPEDSLQGTSQLATIGRDSTISDSDRQWLSNVADFLYDAGFYTKSIYLDQLLNNSQHLHEQ